MPKIVEYNRQINTLGPINQRDVSPSAMGGAEATALESAGKLISGAGNFVEKIQEQDDAIKVNKLSSELYLKQSQKLTDLVQSGKITDPDALSKFNEDFDNDFSAISEQISTGAGQKLLSERQATYKQHFGGAFLKESASAKGAMAKDSAQTFLNNYSSGLFNNPSDVNHALNDWGTSVKAMQQSGLISAEEAATITDHGNKILAESAIKGMMDKDPVAAKSILGTDLFDKYMDGNRKAELMNMAEVHIRGQEADKKRVEAELKDKKEKAAEAEIYAFLPKIYNNEYTAKDVLNSKNLSPQQIEHYVNLIQRHADGSARNNPTVATDVYKQIQSGQITDVNQITEYVGKGLDVRNAEYLGKILAERKDPVTGVRDSEAKAAVFKEAEKRILKNPAFGPDPEGQRRLNDFRFAFEAAWMEGKKAGKTTQQLTQPSSPDYIGNLIPQYQATGQEIMQATMNGMRANKAQGYSGPAVTTSATDLSALQKAAQEELAKRKAAPKK